jgi:hypothetical protein
MSTFNVRLYEPGDEEPILDLFNSVFAEGNPAYVPRPMDVWQHIYGDNPAGQEILVATDADGDIIANYSAIPAFAAVKGQRLRAGQAVDTCVRKDWRGSLRKNSVFVTIAKEYCRVFGEDNEAYTNEYLWGLPNEQAFPVGTRIVGYKPVHVPMPKLTREADPAWRDELLAAGEGVELRESDGTDLDAIADLFQRRVDAVPLGLWKSAEHLAWRYRDWPERPYRATSAWRGGEMVGALVYRLGWMGQHVLPLIDWIGPGSDRGAVAALLGNAATITLDAGGRLMEGWATPGSAHFTTLSELGMTRGDSPFSLCIMVYSEHFDLDWAKANWIVNMGDSDIY